MNKFVKSAVSVWIVFHPRLVVSGSGRPEPIEAGWFGIKMIFGFFVVAAELGGSR